MKNIHKKLELLRCDLLPILGREALNIRDMPHRESYDVDDLLVYITDVVIHYLREEKEKMNRWLE